MGLQTTTGADRVDAAFDDALAVSPSDTIDEAHRLKGVRAIWADVAGTVSVITEAVAAAHASSGAAMTSAQAVSLTLLAGVPVPLRVAYVLSTGTAATGIKAFF